MTETPRLEPSPIAGRRELSQWAIADRVRGILRAKGLTLYKASAIIRANYPREPGYHIPRNLYFQLRSAAWSPTIQQLLALSQLTGYHLADWLGVFGFHLDGISRVQIRLPQPRTVLLDSTVYDPHANIPWFRDRGASAVIPPIAPLSQLLEPTGSQLIAGLLTKAPSPYVYAKIGRQDAYSFPDLAPGSIVRADTRFVRRSERKGNAELTKAIFLVEHIRGICCCRLHFGTKNRITLRSTELPFASVELELGSQARILGIVDMEVRSLPSRKRRTTRRCAEREVARDLARLWTPAPFVEGFAAKEAAFRIRYARGRAGLSLRQASEMSREIARAFEDRRYFASPGSLSEYEATSTPPRHIHKLFTLSILYSIRFRELLDWFGLEQNDTRTAAIPAEWMTPLTKSRGKEVTPMIRGKGSPGGFAGNTLKRLGELPLFLRESFASLSGLEGSSLRDVYWVGGNRETMHPLLNGSLFVILDRRKRRPRIFPRRGAWEQPLYLLRKRDGSYLMASCGMEDGAIVLHPYTDEFMPQERLRKTAEVDIIGEIVTVVRLLRFPP
jgi:transcriptional regulator with XRE-family HTH domain